MVAKIKKPKPAKVRKNPQPSFKFPDDSTEVAARRERLKYRKSKGSDFELVGRIVLRALDHIDVDAVEMPVFNQISNEMEKQPVLRLSYVAKLLNVSYQTLWRWTTETQQLPMPVLIDNSKGREYPVYHLEEVRAMIGAIGEHLCGFKYYRKDHEATVNKVFAEIEALRAENFKTSGDENDGNSQKRQKPRRKAKVRRKRNR